LAVPPAFLRTLEDTAFSTWLRDSPSVLGFWFILTWHAIGMGLLVGASAVIDLRILGVARDLPLAPLKRLYPFIWVGFWIQVVTGVLLLMAYPTKALTNAMFYTKLTLIALAMAAMVGLKKKVFDDVSLSETGMMMKGRAFAAWSLVFGVAAVTAGRFLAYTSTYLTYPSPEESALLTTSVSFFHFLAPY
jgi:hypothetical protein